MEEPLVNQCADFFQWLHKNRNKRFGLKFIFLILCSFVFVVCCALWYYHYSLPQIDDASDTVAVYHSRWKLDQNDDNDEKIINLKLHVEDLKRIKSSVRNELRDLEYKQHRLREETVNYTVRLELLKSSYEKNSKELQELKLAIDSAQQLRMELRSVQIPLLQAPLYVASSTVIDNSGSDAATIARCHMRNCFDYSRCRLASKFYAYIYSKEDLWLANLTVDFAVFDNIQTAARQNVYITSNPDLACIFIVPISSTSGMVASTTFEKYISGLKKLKYWGLYGSNHVLFVTNIPHSFGGILRNFSHGSKALLAQLEFNQNVFQSNFDIVLCPVLESRAINIWSQLPPMIPAHRKYLLSFLGGRPNLLSHESSQWNSENKKNKDLLTPLLQLEQLIIRTLKNMQTDFAVDGFMFDFACANGEISGFSDEWSMCETDNDRRKYLLQSTFALIMAPMSESHTSSALAQIRIYEALKYGTIPVILGDNILLPFAELLSWKQIAIVLPRVRITELHYLLRSIGPSDILNMRREGRELWTKHCSTHSGVLDTLLATVRTRLGIPPSPVTDFHMDTWFIGNFSLLTRQYAPLPADADEFLGPVEFPYASPQFLRNHTQHWNLFSSNADPFHLFPHTPFDPFILPGAYFAGESSLGFRPIGKGEGGAGKEFSEALGGNYPHEQFTVVLLTYEREAVMLDALLRLRGLPYLNKVIVVWNSQRAPSPDLMWPDIGVPVHVAKMTKNSLNNRFLPFDAIETEAILSLDDDVHLRRDEIIFGFRVWRESRERIVGFPGRFHSWNAQHQNWLYNSNYSCELSMVLTGAAFYHKYYTYLYSYVMPQAIRDKVDEYLNCEDIAMNFLVAHVVRKPPLKVTSRWTFLCPECQNALSIEDEHFFERHKCFEFFVKVYGYMPLLYTQLRVDSVLFKTRIPHDKQKCFKYV